MYLSIYAHLLLNKLEGRNFDLIYNYRYLTMPDFPTLPAAHGAYVLHLFLARSQTVTIGRLGPHRLSAGYYFHGR